MSGVAIAEWSEQTPEHTAVIAHGTPYSYRFLARFLLALRSRLEAENLARGSLVVLCVRSTFRGWLGVMALRSLGVATITLREPRMLEVLGLRQPAAILVWEEETWDLAPLERAWPDLRVITIPSNIPRPQGRQRADARTLLAQRAPHLLFSSGTTGAFKMVALDGPQEAEVARLRAETYGFGQSTVFDILNFGLWTAAGFKFPIAVWAAGGTVVLDDSRDRYRNIDRLGVNAVFLTSGMLAEFMADRGRDAPRRDDLMVVTAGGLLPLPLAEAVVEKTTKTLVNLYTSTEINGRGLMARYAGNVADLHWLEPPEGVEIGIVDDEDRPVERGEEGLLRYRRSPLDCHGFLGDPEASARHFRDGWFYPGDVALMRQDGRICIRGRFDDVVELKGEKRAAAPMEATERERLGVSELCLFSGLDEAGRAWLVIAVERAEPYSPGERDRIAASFAEFDNVAVVTLADFPRTETGMGKVKRAEVKRRAFAELGLQSRP